MSNLGLPDPLGIFGEPTDLLGRRQSEPAAAAAPAAAPIITAPAVEPERKMPMPDDEAVKKARRRSIAAQRARTGRASTIFTDQEGLGG